SACPDGQSCVAHYCQADPGGDGDAPDGAIAKPDAAPGTPDASEPESLDASLPPADAAPPPIDASRPCLTSDFADDFNVAGQAYWLPFVESPTTVGESNGKLVIQLFDTSGQHYAGY